jgi:hypothetical protein
VRKRKWGGRNRIVKIQRKNTQEMKVIARETRHRRLRMKQEQQEGGN